MCKSFIVVTSTKKNVFLKKMKKKLKNIGMVRRDSYKQSYDKLKLKIVIIVVP